MSAIQAKHIRLLKQQNLIGNSAIKGMFSAAKPKLEEKDDFGECDLSDEEIAEGATDIQVAAGPGAEGSSSVVQTQADC